MKNLTIIIPSYNSSSRICACLNSIINQDFSSIEGGVKCIVIDDCSTDNSPSIIHEYISRYAGPIEFTFSSNETNRGVSYSRNIGLKSSESEFIMFVDSDDELAPDCLKHFSEYIKKYPDADIYQGQVIEIGKPFCLDKKTAKEEFVITDSISEVIDLFPVTCWNKIIRRKFLIDNNIYFKEGIRSEDVHWAFRLITVLKKIVFVPFETYLYYTFQDNSMTIAWRQDRNADLKNQMVFYPDLFHSFAGRYSNPSVITVCNNRFPHFRNALIEYIIAGNHIDKDIISTYKKWALVSKPKPAMKQQIVDFLISHPNNYISSILLKLSVKVNS